MLASLPLALQILILGVVGLAIGVVINWSIYAWAYFQYRAISPWMKPLDSDLAKETRHQDISGETAARRISSKTFGFCSDHWLARQVT